MKNLTLLLSLALSLTALHGCAPSGPASCRLSNRTDPLLLCLEYATVNPNQEQQLRTMCTGLSMSAMGASSAWVASACPRAMALGGCRIGTGMDTVIYWNYQLPSGGTAAQYEAQCTNMLRGVWVTP